MSDTIKITNEYIEKVVNSPLSMDIKKKEFPIKTAYWIARCFDKIKKLADTYLEEKKKLINKYAIEKDEQGNAKMQEGMISLSDPNKFSEELKELLDIEIDLGINKIKIDLDKCPNLTLEEMDILLPLIEEI